MSGLKTSFTVSDKPFYKCNGSVFKTIQLPNGTRARVLDRDVYKKALAKANETLRIQRQSS